MQYNNLFEMMLMDEIQSRLPEHKAEVITTPKNQQNVRQIIIRKKDGTPFSSPLINIQYFAEKWEKGSSVSDLAKEYIALFEDNLSNAHMLENASSLLTDYAKVKDHLMIKMVAKEGNDAFLTGKPFIDFLDMAAVFHVDLTDLSENASAPVTNQHLEMWHVKKEDLLKAALPKTNRYILDNLLSLMMEVAKELNGNRIPILPEMVESDGEQPMYVIQLTDQIFGAAAIMNEKLLMDVRKRLNSNFYILPSSIYELIVVPDNNPDNLTASYMVEMVREINAEEVPPQERLTDSVYWFDGKLARIIVR